MSTTDTTNSTDTTMNVNVIYFASLADEANCQQEQLTIAQSTSLAQLYEQLSDRHRFSRSQAELRVAINDYFVKWDEPISDGDNVVFITPVAGG